MRECRLIKNECSTLSARKKVDKIFASLTSKTCCKPEFWPPAVARPTSENCPYS